MRDALTKLDRPTIYEIYPRSFRDTTGTGEGDLAGILDGLDHVAALGVDAIWIAPFYPSPRADGGYDVTDHCAVDSRLGTLQDFDHIVEKAHALGLGVLLDLVLKHTSLDHPWFVAAVEGDETAAARYVWRDAKPDGTAPTNWISFFGGPAWTWNHKRRQYYLHQYASEQPALDHRNPDVQAEIRAIMDFWTARGVDGFRFDAVTSWFHDPDFRDNPAAPPDERSRIEGLPFNPYTHQFHRHDMMPQEGTAHMARIRDWAGPDLFLMGENNFGIASVEIALEYTGPERLDACYTTDTVKCGAGLAVWDELLSAINGTWRLPWWFESHDQARSPTQLGDGTAAAARFLALLGGVLPGALMLYQGQELGLPQPHLDRKDVEDPYDLAFWPDGPGRSGARVPIPWTEAPGTWGFTDGTPWLPMRWAPGASIAAQQADPHSALAFQRKVLNLRRALELARPERFAHDTADGVLRLEMETGAGRFVAGFNFSDHARPVPEGGEVLLSSGVDSRQLCPRGAVLRRA
ncbi:alpha-amylase [Sagittula sp. NFXS13]|uniref:alpha-amylase family glycosyl hydrolase n=1 Tax=Sagittula sp. NFXS13 TaxID=2819095 RepID=UPI0032DF1E61